MIRGNLRRIIIVALITTILPSCATQTVEDVPVSHTREGKYVNVRTPGTPGWKQYKSDNQGMVFGKVNDNPPESFMASIIMGGVDSSMSTEQHVSKIREKIENENKSKRYEQIELEITPTSERSYPCVRVRNIVKDNNALIRPGVHGTEILQNIEFHCIHPVRTDTAFAIIYSYRGKGMYAPLQDEADYFINGIVVPGYK